MVAARLPRPDWPDRPMIVVAVNAHTGELAAFDRDSGVDLVDAVTASTALPGIVPTHDINGTRYINGGVRSNENADLASGYANVVVLSPFGGRSQTPPEGQFEGLRRPPGADLASQVEALREQGSHVEVITRTPIPERQWARTRWIWPPASLPPGPDSPKASRKRPACGSADDGRSAQARGGGLGPPGGAQQAEQEDGVPAARQDPPARMRSVDEPVAHRAADAGRQHRTDDGHAQGLA